jgi:hypothetical protein
MIVVLYRSSARWSGSVLPLAAIVTARAHSVWRPPMDTQNGSTVESQAYTSGASPLATPAPG